MNSKKLKNLFAISQEQLIKIQAKIGVQTVKKLGPI
jgi:hypothetical protein